MGVSGGLGLVVFAMVTVAVGLAGWSLLVDFVRGCLWLARRVFRGARS